MAVVRLTADNRALCSHADCRAVPCFWTIWRFAVNLCQLREVNLASKSILNGGQVGVVSICCELNAMSQTLFQIMHKMICRLRVATTDKPARHKLCVRVECYPRPRVASSLGFHFRRAISFLSADKAPNLITLKVTAFQIPKRLVLIFGAGA